jgi:soluble cytochrome b562
VAVESELLEPMGEFGRALRRLLRQIDKPESNEASAELVVKMQRACLDAKGMEPSLVHKQPEAEKARFLLGYRKKMIELMGALLRLESDLLDGDNEKAQASLAAVRKIEDDGHSVYREEE